MVTAAGQAAAAEVQRPGADRAAKIRGDGRERPPLAPHSGRGNVVRLTAGRVAWVHRNVPSNRKDDQPTAARLDIGARMRTHATGPDSLTAARHSAPPQAVRGRLK